MLKCECSVEKREAQLTTNLGTVNTDKAKIEKTIEELDRYKRESLVNTWEKVNKYATSIFSSKLYA